MAVRPLVFLAFPVIACAGFSYGAKLIWFNTKTATASLIFSSSPCSFSPSMVGMTNVSPLLATFLATFYTCYIVYKFLLHLARRNNGVQEPEQHVWLLLPSVIFLPFGLVLWGVGAAHGIHWCGCVFAMGMVAFVSAVGLQILAWRIASTATKIFASEAIVAVILIRNSMGFGASYGIVLWVADLGMQNAFLVVAFVGTAQIATFDVFVRYRKAVRRASRERYRKYVEKMARDGAIR